MPNALPLLRIRMAITIALAILVAHAVIVSSTDRPALEVNYNDRVYRYVGTGNEQQARLELIATNEITDTPQVVELPTTSPPQTTEQTAHADHIDQEANHYTPTVLQRQVRSHSMPFK